VAGRPQRAQVQPQGRRVSVMVSGGEYGEGIESTMAYGVPEAGH